MKITKFSDLDLSKTYTVGDYLNWQFEEMVELIKGKIFKMSPSPRSYHQAISGNLYFELRTIIKKSKCKIFDAPFDVYLKGIDSNNDTVVQPDICIICDKNKIQERGCVGAPDMIVEIISPSTMKKDLDSKFHLYEENGVNEYWIVMPEYKIISVYILGNSHIYNHLGDFSIGQQVPVFTLNDTNIQTESIFDF